jgi:5'-3' exoribonuclease 2
LLLLIAEERQDQNAKRRKLDAQQKGEQAASIGPSASLQLGAPPAAPSLHPSLPPRPTYDFAATADSIGLGASPTPESVQHTPTAVQALAGSNRDVVANRRSIRMANMSAADVLRAELGGGSAKLDLSLPMKPVSSAISSSAAAPSASLDAARMSMPLPKTPTASSANDDDVEEDQEEFPGLGGTTSDLTSETVLDTALDNATMDVTVTSDETHGTKRTYEEGPGAPGDGGDEDMVMIEEEEEEAAPASKRLALKVNPDGTVEQEDTVR